MEEEEAVAEGIDEEVEEEETVVIGAGRMFEIVATDDVDSVVFCSSTDTCSFSFSFSLLSSFFLISSSNIIFLAVALVILCALISTPTGVCRLMSSL